MAKIKVKGTQPDWTVIAPPKPKGAGKNWTPSVELWTGFAMSPEEQAKDAHMEATRAKHNLRSKWAIYEVDDFDAKHTHGKVDKVYALSLDGVRHSVPVVGDTWLALWIAADRAMALMGMPDHVYIECFIKTRRGVEVGTGS